MIKRKEPPINWMMAVLLERKQSKHWTFEDLSAATGYSSAYLIELFGKDPWHWRTNTLEKICSALGVSKDVRIECYAKQ